MIHYGGYPDPRLIRLSDSELIELVWECTRTILYTKCDSDELCSAEMMRADCEVILRERNLNRTRKRIAIIRFRYKA